MCGPPPGSETGDPNATTPPPNSPTTVPSNPTGKNLLIAVLSDKQEMKKAYKLFGRLRHF